MSFIPITVSIFAILLFIWFRQRHIESQARNQVLAVVSPFLLSFIVASATSISRYLFGGMIFSVLVWLWLFQLRFSPLYNLARRKMQTKAYDEAYQALNQVIQQKPDLWEAYLLRSSASLAMGYFAHAERDAKKAIQLKPNTVSSHTALGGIFVSQGLLERAKQAFLEGFRLEPTVTATHMSLGIICYKLGEFENAIQFLMRATGKLRSNHEKLLLYYYLGKCQESLGQQEKALVWYRKMFHFRQSFSLLKKELHLPKSLPINSLLQVDLVDLEQRLYNN